MEGLEEDLENAYKTIDNLTKNKYDLKKYEDNLETMKKMEEDLENAYKTIDILAKIRYDPNNFDTYGNHKHTGNKYDPNGFDREGYNINGVDKDGLDRNGNNINGIKGTRKKYPKRKINYSEYNDGTLYNQYGFNSLGLNEDGYDIYGFDKDELNKDGYDMYGFKKKSSKIKTSKAKSFKDQKGKGYVDLPILLSKLNVNSSKELISNIEQLINNLYNNKQITKHVYNILNQAITYKNDS